MKVRIIQNSRIPSMLSWFINIGAITIYPFIISKGEMDITTINHEMIHIKQQKELFVVGFYPLYAMFWVVNLLWHRMSAADAYRMIPFEIEAYGNQENLNYLSSRPKFAWAKNSPQKISSS